MYRRTGDIGSKGGCGRVACLLVLAAATLGVIATDAMAATAAPTRPNIVTITTDDQARSTLRPGVMPNLKTRIGSQGVRFRDYVVTTPLCCPSRSSYLTGQYGHNNGVLRNEYGDLRRKREVLPVWLHRSGYATAHVGKFMNGFPGDGGSRLEVAPGWDLWFNHLEKRRYYDWEASRNGKLIEYGERDRDNATAVTTRFATRWTKRLARDRKPFYVQVDYYAPHIGPGRDSTCSGAPKPLPADEGRFRHVNLPQPPSFNQEDVSSMPSFIRDRPKLSAGQVRLITGHYRCALEALHGVDRGIGRIFNAVKAAGELNNTVFVFTSDNGYFYGEHRVLKGKPFPYEENVRTILEMRVPKRFRGGTKPLGDSDAPVANIDLAPTLLDLAAADPCISQTRCRTMDGRSLMPLIEGQGFPVDRGLAIEGPDCLYDGVRRSGFTFVEYATGRAQGCRPTEAEMYDLAADPFQIDDLLPATAGSPAAGRRDALAAERDRLVICAGIEGRDPPTPGRPFCE